LNFRLKNKAKNTQNKAKKGGKRMSGIQITELKINFCEGMGLFTVVLGLRTPK
jgi:hypothetical protein